MTEATPKPDRSGLSISAAAVGQLLACYLIAYGVSKRVMGGQGFEGILAGTLGSLFGFLILGAIFSTSIEKLPAEKRATLNRAGIGAMLALVAAFAWFFTIPTMQKKAGTYLQDFRWKSKATPAAVSAVVADKDRPTHQSHFSPPSSAPECFSLAPLV